MKEKMKIVTLVMSIIIIFLFFMFGFGVGVITTKRQNIAYESITEESKMPVSSFDRVYVIGGGKMFHQYGCKSLGNSEESYAGVSVYHNLTKGYMYAITVNDAGEKDYKACEMCFSDAKEFNEKHGK